MAKNIRTVLEISDTHVKLFQSDHTNKKPVIVSCYVEVFNFPSDEQLIQTVGSLLAKYRNSLNDLTVVIPRRLIILKNIRLPSHQDVEIRKMLSLQLATQIPYPVTDVIYDYRLLEKEDSGYSQILVYVVHKDVVGRYFNIIQKCGFNCAQITLSTQGISEWFEYQKRNQFTNVREPALILNIDLTQTELIFISDQKILFSRSISLGARDLSDEQMQSFVQQIQLSIKTYNKDHLGSELKNLVILSSLSQTEELKKRLEKELQLPVFVKDVFDNILSSKNSSLSGLKSDPGVSLTVGLGLCLSTQKNWINLMPADVQINRLSIRNRWQAFKTSALLILLALSGLSVLGVQLFQYISLLNQYQNQISSVKKEYDHAQKRIKFIEALQKNFSQRLFVPDLITQLFDLTPREISFRQIELKDNGEISFQGFATANASVNQFQSALLKSPFFKEVSLQFATQRRIFNMDVIDFQLTARVREAKK